jgi:hypothetical protein
MPIMTIDLETASNFERAAYWVEEARTATTPESQDIYFKLAGIYAQLAAVESQSVMANQQASALELMGQLTKPQVVEPEKAPLLTSAKLVSLVDLIHDTVDSWVGDCPDNDDGDCLCDVLAVKIADFML